VRLTVLGGCGAWSAAAAGYDGEISVATAELATSV
jgi:hypothetical protein